MNCDRDTHHSLGVDEKQVLFGVVLHPGEHVLSWTALGFAHQKVSILKILGECKLLIS